MLLAGLAWALRPIPEPNLPPAPMPRSDEPSDPVAPAAALVDARAFEVVLWSPVQQPVKPAAARKASAPKPRPMRLELIGIIHAPRGFQAVLYDPDTDRLHIVSRGQRVGVHAVTNVQASSIELSDGAGTRRLLLKEAESDRSLSR